MLTEYGIQWTSDKKRWITQALQLIQGLEPDDSKLPWKFLKAIHEHIQAGKVASGDGIGGEGPEVAARE